MTAVIEQKTNPDLNDSTDQDPFDRVREFGVKWWLGEQAFARELAGTPQIGDGMAMLSVGLNDPKLREQEAPRVKGIAVQMQRAGTNAQLLDAQDTVDSIRARNAEAMPAINKQIGELKAQLQRLESRKEVMVEELVAAEVTLKPMSDARIRLRQMPTLPPFIRAEMRTFQQLAKQGSGGEDMPALQVLLGGLEADAKQDPKNDENPHFFDQRAERAKSNPLHRGYPFWKDRTYSITEWGSYRAWCRVQSSEVQAKIDSIREKQTEWIGPYLELLNGYYVDKID